MLEMVESRTDWMHTLAMGLANPIDGYAVDAATLIPQFEAISSDEVFAPIVDLLPTQPGRIIEIGAGTGRDAAWLATKGHKVLAVEPVEEFRIAGASIHPSPNIRWLDARLPYLDSLREVKRANLILLVAVWQHVRPECRSTSIAALASLMQSNGRLIMSVRHGPGSDTRPCFAADPAAIICSAELNGLRLVAHRFAQSVQVKNREAGVTWSWLCFDS